MAYCRALGGSPPEIPAVAASLLSSRGAGPRTLICRRLTGHGQLRLISREVNAPPIAADCDNSFSSSNGAAFAIAQDLMSRRLPKMDSPSGAVCEIEWPMSAVSDCQSMQARRIVEHIRRDFEKPIKGSTRKAARKLFMPLASAPWECTDRPNMDATDIKHVSPAKELGYRPPRE